ncbi:MAG TPA: response regulator FixJ [Caulobacteraceae bacterium]|jgi:two-component system, LuxR family, response regulator FixJ|nr:response regulator FixJ [Caulobacteraceae bacterium]
MPAEPVVHVIDDDEAVRESLSFLLETADYKVHAYDSATRFLADLDQADFGCVITDVRMPGMTGLELVRALNERKCAMPVIVITGHGDVPLAVEAMREGVVDFIEKPFGDDTILASLHNAFERSRDLSAQSGERNEVLKRLASLSTRERQVLEGLVAGQANKVVALDLGISPRTVEVYRANLMSKMHAGSLSELVRMALQAGSPR